MSLELFRAVQAARLLLNEGHPLARAATVAAAEFGAHPEEVARLADEAHRACSAAGAPAGNNNAAKQMDQIEPVVSTAEKLAVEHGVSPATVITIGTSGNISGSERGAKP